MYVPPGKTHKMEVPQRSTHKMDVKFNIINKNSFVIIKAVGEGNR